MREGESKRPIIGVFALALSFSCCKAKRVKFPSSSTILRFGKIVNLGKIVNSNLGNI